MNPTIDADKLISSVQKRRILWDRYYDHHHNRYALDVAWRAVAKEIGISDARHVKNKWKNLRDCYRKKLTCTKWWDHQDCKEEMPIWRHYDAMSFLKEQFVHPPDRKFQGSYSSAPAAAMMDDFEITYDSPSVIAEDGSSSSLWPTSEADHRDDDDDDDDDEKDDERKSDVSTFPEDDYNEKRPKFASENSKRPKKRAIDDDDWKFFQSVIPHVKKIPDRSKLLFRNEIQSVVQKYAYPAEDSHFDATCKTEQQ